MTPILLCRHRVIVRFRDCDPLGHINNAVYLTYLEQARFTLWRRQLGYIARPAAEGGVRGTGMILARVEIDFRAQARYGDELEVALSLTRIGRSSFSYAYEIRDLTTERVVVEATSVQVWFDYDAERSVPLDEEMKARMQTPCLRAHFKTPSSSL